MSSVSKDSVEKFARQFRGNDVEYLNKTAPKPKLKSVPKPIMDERKLLPMLPKEVLMEDIEKIDPWNKVVELLNKCNRAVLNRSLDFAEIYYEQIRPFYVRLNGNDKKLVFFKIKELQENILQLRMKKVRKILRIIS